jgi:DNA polymerase III delta prime subunit
MSDFFLQRKNTIQDDPFISKYKPYYIDNFKGNENLISVIESLIHIDDINILVTGPSNSGKTSLLYAIIRKYYNLDKTRNFPENNIMFINSLKEQGINYYRNEMKSFCQSKCSIYGKKKLVIIDDLDLINEQCQQVFRNHIDKYKNNVHFVSVCSNIHKVIESIQSRLHIIRMVSPNLETIQYVMNNIISNEHLQITNDAKNYLLTFSKHSIREIISHLEKICILSEKNNVVDIEKCKNIISNISYKQFEIYLEHIKNQHLEKAVEVLYEIYDYGYSVIDILDMFFSFIKTTNIIDEEQKYKILPILCKYITYFHSLHEDIIEVVMFSQEILTIIR